MFSVGARATFPARRRSRGRLKRRPIGDPASTAGGQKPALAQGPVRPGDQHRACSENKYRACSGHGRSMRQRSRHTIAAAGQGRLVRTTLSRKMSRDRATPGGYGGKPPGVAFIGAPTGARNAGTVPQRGTRAPTIMLHRTPPLCVKTGLQVNLARQSGESCHWCPFTTCS